MSEPITPEELEQMRKRCDKATAGPWAWEVTGTKEGYLHIGIACDIHGCQVGGEVEIEQYDEERDVFVENIVWGYPIANAEGTEICRSDADFIAHARTDEPRLIAEVERLRARVEALEAMAYPDWNAIGDDRDA